MAIKVLRAEALSKGQLGSVALDGMRDQAKQREFAMWFDQHRDSKFTNAAGERIFEDGRPYWSTVEKSTKMPVGPVYRMGWTAPWEAPQAYIVSSIGKISKVTFGNGVVPRGMTTDRFRIDYEQMRKDDKAAYDAFLNHAIRVAFDRNITPPKYGQPLHYHLTTIVGPPPRDPRIAQAALAGNKWLLGQLMPTFNPVTNQMEVEEDEELARILRQGNDQYQTVEEMEREAERNEVSAGPVPDQVQEMFAEFKKMKAELDALKAENQRKKGGRPPSKKDNTPAAV